jgi:hypothetical protein
MNSIGTGGGLTRREAIKTTVVFSTGLLVANWLDPRRAGAAPTEFSGQGIHLLALGDFGSGNANQTAVARQMASFATKLNTPLTAVLALGDNFYKRLSVERFGPDFEQMYDRERLACPFYACLGNHDYGPLYDSGQGRPKAQMQIDYSKDNPASRWKMPAKWYTVELPDARNPLVKIIFLDGNMAVGALTPQEKLEQKRFLEAELENKTRAPWRWMISHFPMFSECKSRGDSSRMIQLWGEQLKTHAISLYLSGHDHTLQHLEAEGYDTSFVVSGSGGGSLYEVKPTNRGFAEKIYGFNHFHVTPEKFEAQFIDAGGNRLHAFRRTLAGKVEVIS